MGFGVQGSWFVFQGFNVLAAGVRGLRVPVPGLRDRGPERQVRVGTAPAMAPPQTKPEIGPRVGFRIQDAGVWVSGLEFRVSGSGGIQDFGFRVSGFEFRSPGSQFRVSGFELRVSGFGFRVSGFRHRVSGFGFRVSGFGLRIPGFGFRISGFGPARAAWGLTRGPRRSRNLFSLSLFSLSRLSPYSLSPPAHSSFRQGAGGACPRGGREARGGGEKERERQEVTSPGTSTRPYTGLYWDQAALASGPQGFAPARAAWGWTSGPRSSFRTVGRSTYHVDKLLKITSYSTQVTKNYKLLGNLLVVKRQLSLISSYTTSTFPIMHVLDERPEEQLPHRWPLHLER